MHRERLPFSRWLRARRLLGALWFPLACKAVREGEQGGQSGGYGSPRAPAALRIDHAKQRTWIIYPAS